MHVKFTVGDWKTHSLALGPSHVSTFMARHVPMSASKWKMRQYIHTMRSQRKMTWDALYWRLLGMFHIFHCTLCGRYVSGVNTTIVYFILRQLNMGLDKTMEHTLVVGR